MPFVPVGFAVFSTRAPSARDLDVRTRLSSGCSALQSFFRTGPVRRLSPSNSCPELWFPSAHRGNAEPISCGHPIPIATPSGFAYPPGVLLPASPCRVCFAPAALLGFTLRSVPLVTGIPAFLPRWAHVPFAVLAAFPVGRNPAGKASCVGYWVSTPRQVPCLRRPRRPAVDRMLPWVFALLGSALPRPGTGFRRSSSHALSWLEVGASYNVRPRVSISRGPGPSARDAPTLLGFLHLPTPVIRAHLGPGLWVHLAVGGASLPLPARALEPEVALPELTGLAVGASPSRLSACTRELNALQARFKRKLCRSI